MFHLLRNEESYFIKQRDFFWSQQPRFSVVAIPLLLGLLFGTILGCFSGTNSAFQILKDSFYPDLQNISFLLAIWHSVRFLLCIVILSSSTLGIILIPVLVCLRGMLISGVVAASFQAEAFRGLLLSAFSTGVASLLSLPPFLLLSLDCWSASFALFGYAFRMNQQRSDNYRKIPMHILFIVVFVLLEVVYSFFLLPYLLKMIR